MKWNANFCSKTIKKMKYNKNKGEMAEWLKASIHEKWKKNLWLVIRQNFVA